MHNHLTRIWLVVALAVGSVYHFAVLAAIAAIVQ